MFLPSMASDCKETETSVNMSGPIPSSTEESLFDLEGQEFDEYNSFNRVKQINKMAIDPRIKPIIYNYRT